MGGSGSITFPDISPHLPRLQSAGVEWPLLHLHRAPALWFATAPTTPCSWQQDYSTHQHVLTGPWGIPVCNLASPYPWWPSSRNICLLLLLLLSRFSRVRLCETIERSPPGSTVPGILQARTLEWVAISFSSAGKWKVKVKSFSHVWHFTTPSTTAYQASPSMGFSRQEYWSGSPLPLFGYLHICNSFISGE